MNTINNISRNKHHNEEHNNNTITTRNDGTKASTTLHHSEATPAPSTKDDSIINHLRRFIQGCYKRVDNILHNMTNTTPAPDTLSLQVRAQDLVDVSLTTDTCNTCPTEISTVTTAVQGDFTQDNEKTHETLQSKSKASKFSCVNIRSPEHRVARKGLGGTVWIAINNISGLGLRTFKLHRILEWMENNSYHILLGQEANVSFRHQRVKQYIWSSFKTNYHISASETKFDFCTYIKPGGTFIITNRNLRHRIVSKIRDQAGRWTVNVYSFKDGQKIALISMYQICQWKNKGGTTSRARLTKTHWQNSWITLISNTLHCVWNLRLVFRSRVCTKAVRRLKCFWMNFVI